MSVPPRPLLPYVKAALAVAVWGASFVATKVALAELPPMTIVWVRFAVGLLVLGGFVVARGEFRLPQVRDLAYLAMLGFLGITVHQWLQVHGMQTTEATTTAWIVTTIPVFIAVLGVLFLGERLTLFQSLGILVAALGVMVVLGRGDVRSLAWGAGLSVGDMLVFLSAPNWAVFSVLSRRELQRHPPARMMFMVMFFGLLFTTPWLPAEGGLAVLFRVSAPGWVSLAFLGVFCSGLAYVFWYDALRAMPAYHAGSMIYLEPLVAAAVAGVVLGESLTLAALGGGLLIVTGVWMVTFDWRR
jgi:drug/metabolite transporter (DMT)-like permease